MVDGSWSIVVTIPTYMRNVAMTAAASLRVCRTVWVAMLYTVVS
jgi:hypothetical protein